MATNTTLSDFERYFIEEDPKNGVENKERKRKVKTQPVKPPDEIDNRLDSALDTVKKIYSDMDDKEYRNGLMNRFKPQIPKKKVRYDTLGEKHKRVRNCLKIEDRLIQCEKYIEMLLKAIEGTNAYDDDFFNSLLNDIQQW